MPRSDFVNYNIPQNDMGYLSVLLHHLKTSPSYTETFL
jgi:hypothetical protein